MKLPLYDFYISIASLRPRYKLLNRSLACLKGLLLGCGPRPDLLLELGHVDKEKITYLAHWSKYQLRRPCY